MPPKRKQPASSSAKPKDPQQTVLGGMKGDFRLSGKPLRDNSEPATFSVPFEGKEIICQRVPVKSSAPATLIFTHGAGGGIANPATSLFAKGFAEDEGASVVCFQGTMNLQSRVKTFHAVINHEKIADENVVLGGRSMGARAAIIAMNERGLKKGKLVLASYPLVGQNGETRDRILLDIDQGVEVLFVSGDRDNMCNLKQLNEVRAKMKAKTWLMVVKGADHGMSLKPKDAVEHVRTYSGAAAAKWVSGEGLEQGKTECVLRWDAHGRKVIEDGWKEPDRPTSLKTATANKSEVRQDAEQDEPPSKKRKKR